MKKACSKEMSIISLISNQLLVFQTLTERPSPILTLVNIPLNYGSKIDQFIDRSKTKYYNVYIL